MTPGSRHECTKARRHGVILGLAVLLTMTSTVDAAKRGRLGSMEQMSIEAFSKLREVERHQIKIAEKYYLKGEYKVAANEYEKFLTLYESSTGAPYAQLMWSHCQFELRRVNTAIREGFQSVIDYWPDSREAVYSAYLIGKSYKSMGEIKPAQKAYAKVLEDHPKDIVTVLSKLDLLDIARIQKDEETTMNLWKDLAYETKRTKQNWQYCANIANQLARHHLYKGDYDDGVKALETNYKGNDLKYRIYQNCLNPISHLTGNAATKKKGLDIASKTISLIQEQMPLDIKEEKKQAVEMWYRIANVYGYSRRPEEVMKTYKKMVEVFGKDDTLLGRMAEWHKGRKERDEARRIYGQFEDQVKGQSNIAGMWKEEGKYDRAIPIYTDLMKLDADNADNWQWAIADCYKDWRKYKEAIQSYRQTSKMPGSYQMMAWCHRRLKQYTEALVLYNQIIGSHPSSSSWAKLEIARTYEEAGKKTTAIKAFQKVCKDHPKSGHASQAHAHLQNKYKITVTLGGAKDE